jgi:uncharacterized protein YndB with AHSA1/START domain
MTNVFHLDTMAGPERVWEALTDPVLTARYLHGLRATSAWRPGARVTFAAGDFALSGEVLASEGPRRLSYTVAAGDGQPATYVTWEIWPEGDGAVVRLYVDDPDQPMATGPDPEAQAVWSEVIQALAAVLAPAPRVGRLP